VGSQSWYARGQSQSAPNPERTHGKGSASYPKRRLSKNVEQEIASLKEDVYTRATWKKLQEVKQEADDTASTLRLATLCSAGVGFVLGCVVTIVAVRRMRKTLSPLSLCSMAAPITHDFQPKLSILPVPQRQAGSKFCLLKKW
jgi:hypothetical protein